MIWSFDIFFDASSNKLLKKCQVVGGLRRYDGPITSPCCFQDVKLGYNVQHGHLHQWPQPSRLQPWARPRQYPASHRTQNGPHHGEFDIYDDVIKWKHFPRYWPFVRGIHWSPVNSPEKGQWRGVLMFSLICVWMNGWVKNRGRADLRQHRTHFDVIVMSESALCYDNNKWYIKMGQYRECLE